MELENEAGVTYHDIQRGVAETLTSESIHPAIGKEGDKHEVNYGDAEKEKEERIARLQKYEERNEARKGQSTANKDNVSHVTMLNGGKMSDEVWEGDPEAEKENFVQEELYVHGKVCIVDDRVAICGSANINDRVSGSLSPLQTKNMQANALSPNSDTTTARSPSLLRIKISSTAQ